MGADVSSPGSDTRLGYARSAVDSFRAAAEAERARLLLVVEEARRRLERAQAATHTQRLMLDMLLDAQREIGGARREAEDRAAEIVAAAHARAGHAIGSNPATPASAADGLVTSAAIDLGAAEQVDASRASGLRPGAQPRLHDRVHDPEANGGEADEYFRYLRGALADDSPLGPAEGRAHG